MAKKSQQKQEKVVIEIKNEPGVEKMAIKDNKNQDTIKNHPIARNNQINVDLIDDLLGFNKKPIVRQRKIEQNV